MTTLAKRVRKRRDELGLTQGELAERSGIKQSDISKIENEKILQPAGILGLARALECEPEWLSGIEEKNFSNRVVEKKLSPHAIALGQLFDSIPTHDKVKWAIVYQKVSAIILEAIQGTPPTSGLGGDQETPAAQRQAPTTTHKS